MPETENTTVRNMVLTIFSQPPEWDVIKSKIRYFAYADETCPDTGRPHKQAFAQAWKAMRLTQWRKLFPNIHMEVMKGTFRESRAYCSKEGCLVEFGEKPNENGVKSVLINYKRKLDEGNGVLAVAEQEDYFPTYLQYRNGLHEYANYIRTKRLKTAGYVKPECHIRIGPSGTGKSKWCDDTYGFCNYYDVALARDGRFIPWVNPIQAHHDVWVFNDVGPKSIFPSEWFRRLVDGRPLDIETKGGFFSCRPGIIVITSNSQPETWWPDLGPLDWEAIRNRFTTITCVESI